MGFISYVSYVCVYVLKREREKKEYLEDGERDTREGDRER